MPLTPTERFALVPQVERDAVELWLRPTLASAASPVRRVKAFRLRGATARSDSGAHKKNPA